MSKIFSQKITIKLKWEAPDTSMISLVEEVYTPPATPSLKIIKYGYSSANQVEIIISPIKNLDLNQT